MLFMMLRYEKIHQDQLLQTQEVQYSFTNVLCVTEECQRN